MHQDSTQLEAALSSLIRIRRATDQDTAEVADLYWTARQAAVPDDGFSECDPSDILKYA